VASILVIDDEKVLAQSLGILFSDEGHQTRVALNGRQGLTLLEEFEPEVILLDLRLPDLSGMDVLRELRRLGTRTQIIMMSAHGDTATVVEAVKLGAFDYINKPFELQEILLLVHQALEQQKLQDEVAFLRERQVPEGTLEEMVGDCPAMREVCARIRLVANSGDSSVLITGESGTGKELVASALHRLSPHREGAFLEVNCSAIPENLLESELFGYEKGAFTHAQTRKKGLLELAQNGTIFLDEIGDMPLLLQAKLLRFLEKRTIRRLGGTADIAVRARIIAATHHDLAEAVRNGAFREDLYYRLNVIPIHLPPLRARGEDVLLLARTFLARTCRELGRSRKQFAPAVEQRFLAYGWPGNIRELKNIVERLTILCPDEEIPVRYLPGEMSRPDSTEALRRPGLQPGETIDDCLSRLEHRLIEQALEQVGGRKADAAGLLGISRHSLKRRLYKFGLHDEEDLGDE
jgi:two-component system response regulator AtoC